MIGFVVQGHIYWTKLNKFMIVQVKQLKLNKVKWR